MTLRRAILNRKPAIARVLLLIFAFTAWSLTGPANIALALLVALFLADVPSHWGQLRREPAFLLLIGVLLVTSLLAVRAAWLLPDTAADQWRGISAWSTPFLFIVPAWWLRRDPDQVWPLMGAAALGLAFGVLHKTDWSLAPQVLAGLRYHFGFAALSLAFMVSVTLVGLLLFRTRITGLTTGKRPQPLLGWALWVCGLSFLIAVLVVTQSRGAALGLAMAGVLYGVFQGRTHRDRPGHPAGRRRTERAHAFAFGLLVTALAGLLLWATKDRQLQDWQHLTTGGQGTDLSYTGSATIRFNLHEVGLAAFEQAPLLGFGPGTSTTEYLVPRRIVLVSPYHQAHVAEISHLHSAALEILARFGMVGVLIALLLAWVLVRAYRSLWRDDRAAPDLRAFLSLTGVMLVFFCLYDFRVMNLDQRFFLILFFGVLYSFQLRSATGADEQPPRHD